MAADLLFQMTPTIVPHQSIQHYALQVSLYTTQRWRVVYYLLVTRFIVGMQQPIMFFFVYIHTGPTNLRHIYVYI
jgi:hypothetical protein